MLRAMRGLFIATFLLSSACHLVPKRRAVGAPPAPPPTAPGVAPVHSVSEVAVPAVTATSEPLTGFMRGINLGNALDAPREGAWGVTLSAEHFSMAKAAGLDHVRVPVRFSAHADSTPPYALESSLLGRLDWVLEQAQKNGLGVIIDLHHYDELMKKPHEHADRLVGIWAQLAEHFRNAPANVAFELINEPREALEPNVLNAITARALAAVRAKNPTRIVIVDGYHWADVEQLKNLVLPNDPNVIPSFHMYQPILLTHQGASFMSAEYQTRGVVFPGPPQAPVVPVPAAEQIDWVRTWFSAYNSEPIATNPGGPKAVFDYFKVAEEYLASTHHRLYLGEFGIADTVDPQSRENWLRLVKSEAERRHIGWALWDDGARFRAMNVGFDSWVAPVEAGLFH